jgi:hypothetical protein
MSEESLINTALKDLVAGRVYPDVALAGAAAPYITYQDVGGQALGFLDGSMPALQNARVQLAVWAKTRIEAKAVLFAASAALRASAGLQASALGAPTTDFDPETGLRCARQDFNVWCDS